MNKPSIQERNLVIIQGLYFFAGSLANIFVTTFLFKNGGVATPIMFWGIHYVNLFIWYLVSGWTLRKFSSAFLTRIGLFSSGILFLSLFLLREKSINFIIPLAMINGFSSGNFWAGYNLNQYLLTKDGRRINYFGISGAISSFAKAFAPLIGGAIITLGTTYLLFGINAGYMMLFFIVFLTYCLSSIMVGKLPEHGIPNFSFKELINHKRTLRWKLVLSQSSLQGLYDITLSVVATVLAFIIVKQEFILGFTQTLTFVLAAVVSLLAIRILKKEYRWYWIGVLGEALGVAIFAFSQNFKGLLLFIFLTGCTSPFLNNWVSTVYHHTLDEKSEDWTDKYYLLIEREAFLDFGRVVSCLLVYVILHLGNQIQFARVWMFILPIFPLWIGVILDKYGDIRNK